MSHLAIIKTGTSFPELVAEYGDFEQWIQDRLDIEPSLLQVYDATKLYDLPSGPTLSGAVITGSHSMVTEEGEWMTRLQEWIREAVSRKTPLLGICFGHQLLARALGGAVADNPKGREVGTVTIHMAENGTCDPLFEGLPRDFGAHVEHTQSVVAPPEGAVVLASSPGDDCHAMRIGRSAWGVQFHPEFTESIMTSYITIQRQELKQAGLDPVSLIRSVEATPVAASILARFAVLAQDTPPILQRK